MTQQSYFNKSELWNFLDFSGAFVPMPFLLFSASLIFAPTRRYIVYIIEANVKLLYLGPKIKLQKSIMQET